MAPIRDTQDQRRQVIEITAEGQRLVDDRSHFAEAIVADIKAGLGEAHYQLLLDLIERLDQGAD